MSRNYKPDRYKIIFNGIISNISPLLIGGASDEETDSDILKDKDGNPFIPGTSLTGVLRHHLYKNYKEFRENDHESPLLIDYFGYSKGDDGSNSKIIFSDLCLKNEAKISIRDGIRINYTTGIVEENGKYDFEVVENGAEFSFNIEIGGDEKDELLKFIATLKRDIGMEWISIGSKTNLGFGKINLKDCFINLYDLENKPDIIKWIKKEKNLFNGELPNPYHYQSNIFRLEFDFFIKDSLIVRHYSSDSAGPDSVHIKSGGKNIIPGTSIKGVIRARAEKILNTLDIDNKEQLFNFLFGNSSKDDKSNGNNYSGSIPSRVKINEVIIKQDVETSSQQRIKIDRFTGGTINGALFDSMPLFAKDYENTNKLVIELKNPIDAEVGLLLLILKDLWTEDLPIGGEKNVGRGILKGKKALISHKDTKITIDNIDSVSGDVKAKLQKYVDALTNSNFQNHLKIMRDIYYEYDKEAANG